MSVERSFFEYESVCSVTLIYIYKSKITSFYHMRKFESATLELHEYDEQLVVCARNAQETPDIIIVRM